MAILAGYAAGTRFGIALDPSDGLLRAGVPGVQLTWMDAKVGDWVVTPRIGKPVEVQALWINALRIAGLRGWGTRWAASEARARAAFAARFCQPAPAGCTTWSMSTMCPGPPMPQLRPNQILAVGGLPFPLIEGAAARAVVDRVEAQLLTPLGLRTPGAGRSGLCRALPRRPACPRRRLSPGHGLALAHRPLRRCLARRARPRRGGEGRGPPRFLPPLLAHLGTAGLGHVSEVADGDPPHAPGGCPFQAWSLGELLRVRAMLDVAEDG